MSRDEVFTAVYIVDETQRLVDSTPAEAAAIYEQALQTMHMLI